MNAKLRMILAVLATAGAAFSTFPVAAQQPASLDQLLEQTRQLRAKEAEENKAREARFLAERNKQAELLRQVEAELGAQQQRTARLSAQYDANEKIIVQLSNELDVKAAAVGSEMFGVVRQVAGDFQAISHNSLISGQYPKREAFVSELAESKALPSIETLEKLWYEMQLEMTETGRTTHFEATVVKLDGTESTQPLVRVGPFTALDADGKFLSYSPESKKFQELGRQPGSAILNAASETFGASSGFVSTVIDPTRGSLLALLMQRPQFMDQVKAGGAVGYIIMVLAALGILIGLERLVSLGTLGAKMNAQRKQVDSPSSNNPLGRVLQVYQADKAVDVATLELRLDEAIMKETPKIEARLSALKVLAAVGPLLGLFGTVIGMIQTFQAITLFGTGDPKLMAGGISQALVTTVQGLIMAIPMVLMHAYLAARAKSLVQILEEESAGIIAEQAEKNHA